MLRIKPRPGFRVTVALVALALLAGCQGGSTAAVGGGDRAARQGTTAATHTPAADSGSSSPSPAIAIAEDPKAYRGGAAEKAGYFEVFKSPSGNIRCGLESAGDTDWASCFVSGRSWQLPHCAASSVIEIFLSTPDHRPAELTCVEPSDPSDPGQSARVLPYGHSIQEIAITCTSDAQGMACGNGRHGFQVSRARYRLY
jgi:hypothetical protein